MNTPTRWPAIAAAAALTVGAASLTGCETAITHNHEILRYVVTPGTMTADKDRTTTPGKDDPAKRPGAAASPGTLSAGPTIINVPPGTRGTTLTLDGYLNSWSSPISGNTVECTITVNDGLLKEPAILPLQDMGGGEYETSQKVTLPALSGGQTLDGTWSCAGDTSPPKFTIIVAPIAVTPASITFPDTPVGQTSRATLTVKSYSSKTLWVRVKPPTGDGSFGPQRNFDFALSGNTKQIDATVTFSPTSAGAKNAQVMLEWGYGPFGTQPSQTITVPLGGTGVGGPSPSPTTSPSPTESPTPTPSPTPAIAASPNPVAYPNTQVGLYTYEVVTITNKWSSDLVFGPNAVTITGTDTSQFAVYPPGDNCSGTTVPPNGTCTVGVAFSPTTTGAKSADLTLANNGPGSPQKVPMTGTATSPPG